MPKARATSAADVKGPRRSILDKHGYVLWKRNFFRFCISPTVDISRLKLALGRSLDVVLDVRGRMLVSSPARAARADAGTFAGKSDMHEAWQIKRSLTGDVTDGLADEAADWG